MMHYNTTEHETVINVFSNVSKYETESGYDDIINVAFFINKYYLWVILVIGFPGNLATIITITRARSFGSFTLYVVLLAFVDNLAILVKTIIYQLNENRVNVAVVGCRILYFLGNFLATFANWILVLMAVERLVAVRYPLKIKKFLNSKTSSIAVSLVGAVIAGAYSPILWVFSFNEKFRLCEFSRKPSLVKMLFIVYWTNISMFAFIPFLVLGFCNLLIVLVIRKSFRIRHSMGEAYNQTSNKQTNYYVSVQRQIMLMLFTSTLVFVVFLFPLCAFHVANASWQVTPLTRAYAAKYLTNQLAYLLCDSTHAVNFYVYFLSARKFRCHFLQMMTCSVASSRELSLLNGYWKRSIQS